MTLKEVSREAAVTAVEMALKEEGNLQAAAERLGVCKRTLELRRASERRQGKAGSPGPLPGRTAHPAIPMPSP